MFMVGSLNRDKSRIITKIVFRFFYLAIYIYQLYFVIKTYFPLHMHLKGTYSLSMWYHIMESKLTAVIKNQLKLRGTTRVHLQNAIRLSRALTFSLPVARSSTTL